MCGPNPLFLRGKLGAGDSFLIVWHFTWGGVYGECASAFPTLINLSTFLVALCVGVTQLVPGFTSEGIALSIAAHLVHLWEEGSSGDSFIAILVPSSCRLYFTFKQSVHWLSNVLLKI